MGKKTWWREILDKTDELDKLARKRKTVKKEK